MRNIDCLQETADEIQRWSDRVRDVLRTIHEDPSVTIEFDEETYEFTIREDGRDPHDFNEASDGFSAVMGVVVGLFPNVQFVYSSKYNWTYRNSHYQARVFPRQVLNSQ